MSAGNLIGVIGPIGKACHRSIVQNVGFDAIWLEHARVKLTVDKIL